MEKVSRMEGDEVMTQEEILFTTNVGSHMWKMNHSESDVDEFVGYIAPLREILLGHKPKSFHRLQFNIDKAGHEIGHIVQQIKKNNVNFIWGVLSPLIIMERPSFNFKRLRVLTTANLSKQIWHSINGLATHNYQKYIYNNPKDLTDAQIKKKCGIVLRTIIFGVRVLEKGEIMFEAPRREVEACDVARGISRLKMAYEESKLPDRPRCTDDLDDWLCELRLTEAKLAKEWVK